MTNRFLISVAALALIAGTGAAGAQEKGAHESGGAAVQSAPASAGGGAAAGATTQNRESTEPSAGMNSTPSEKTAPGAAKGQRAQETAPGQKSKSMSSENDNAKGGKDMKAEGRQDRNGNMNADSKGGAEGKTVGQAGAGAKLSTEQRTKITTVIKQQRVAPVTNVNFSVSVGTRVTRDVSFHPLPAEIVTIYPDWRGYEFILVRDQIVVIDPSSLEIVAVLDA